jgi:hypothetical protein
LAKMTCNFSTNERYQPKRGGVYGQAFSLSPSVASTLSFMPGTQSCDGVVNEWRRIASSLRSNGSSSPDSLAAEIVRHGKVSGRSSQEILSRTLRLLSSFPKSWSIDIRFQNAFSWAQRSMTISQIQKHLKTKY